MPSSITVSQSNVVSADSRQLNPILLLNIALLVLCSAFVFYYVVRANVLAANDYKISSLRSDLNQVTAENAGLLAVQATNDNPSAIMAYAQKSGMVPAGNASYVFANNRVALNQ